MIENGVALNVASVALIVAPALRVTAQVVLRTIDRAAQDAGAGARNIKLCVDSRVANGLVHPATGVDYTASGGAANWYLAGDPEQAAGIEVGFVEGVREPVLRSGPLTQGTFGMWLDVKFDVGVRATGRAIYKATGEAS